MIDHTTDRSWSVLHSGSACVFFLKERLDGNMSFGQSLPASSYTLAEIWEWRRSRINCAAHDLPPGRAGRPHFPLHSSVQRPSPARPGGGRHTYVAKRGPVTRKNRA